MKNPEKQWIKKVDAVNFSDAAVPEKLFINFFWPYMVEILQIRRKNLYNR